jgi:acetyl-CoA C-acetyltransferase
MDNAPVVVGVGSIQQKGTFDDLDEALILMDKAVKIAVNDSNKDISKYIDEIRIPKGYWKYRDPGSWIAINNNFVKEPKTYITKIGVLQQNLINEAIKNIHNGSIEASLIVGGESRYKMVQAYRENREYKEIKLEQNPYSYVKAISDLNLKEEVDELTQMAVGYYAILESAYRFNKKLSLDEHNIAIAKLYEGFSEVAYSNIDAWSDKKFSAEEIINISEKNKQQAYPYNKLHCTSWNINQASAVIICNKKIADLLNIDESKRIYPLASSENNHMIPLIKRPKLINPIGMLLAANFIKDKIDKLDREINLFDLYSCFPVAVEMFADFLNLKLSKKLTITGGMSFAGGPLNHYVLASTVKLVEKLRSDKSKIGLITGVSGVMTKQSFALWSGKFIEDFSFKDVTEDAKLNDKPKNLSSKDSGTAKIIGYTILNDKKYNEKKAVIYAEDENKDRLVLHSKNNMIISEMEKNEWVGKKVKFKNKSLL